MTTFPHPLLLLAIPLIGLHLHETLGVLEPTKILNNGVYKLEIQSEDKYLTATSAPTPEASAIRSRWGGRAEQKWKFTAVINNTDKGWRLTPLSGQPIPPLFKISYVGHGKYRFLNEASGMCLAGIGGSNVGERKCEKDSPFQRWLVLETN